MVDRVHVGNFTADTMGGSQTVSWTGNDFTPNGIRLFTQGHTTADVLSATFGTRFSHGWGCENTSVKVWSVAVSGEEDSMNSNYSKICSKTKILTVFDDTGGKVGEATLTSFGNKEFVINWSTTPTSAFIVYYQAFEAINIDIAFQTANTSATSQDVNHTTFTANAMMSMGTSQTNLDTVEDGLNYFNGMATGATEEVVVSCQGEHDQAILDDDRGYSAAACVRALDTAGAVDYEADFTSFASAKITINWSNAAPSAFEIGYFLMEFDDAMAGTDLNPSTSTTENTITGLGFTANGLMTATTQTQSSTGTDGVGQVGAADSESTENNASAGFYTEHGSTTGENGIFQSNTKCVKMVFSSGGTRGDGAVTAYGSGTIEFTWTSVSGQRRFIWLAFDATTATSTPAARKVYQAIYNQGAII